MESLRNKIEFCLDVFNSFCLMLLVLLVIVQIILRALKLPLLGIEELMNFPAIWLYLIGGAAASLKEEHIDCGMLESFVKSKKALERADWVKSILSLVITLIVTIFSFEMTKYSFKTWKLSATLNLPMFLAEVSIFTGLALMFLLSLSNFIQKLKASKKKEMVL